MKFYVIVLSAWLGFSIFDCTAYGVHPSVAAGKLWDSVSHAVCGADVNDYHDERDSIWRAPPEKMVRRPIYAKRGSGYVCGKNRLV